MIISWSDLKLYIQNKEDLRYMSHSEKYLMWLTLGGQKVESEIFFTNPPTSDQIDFESNYKKSANFASPRKTSDGGIVVGQTYGATPETACWRKRMFLAKAGEANFFDIKIEKEIRLRGGSYNIADSSVFNEEDYLEFSLIDKDDILGLFSMFGLTPGEDVLELNKFVITEYIQREGWEFGKTSWSAFPVTAGLYLRIAYNSVGANDVKFFIRMLWFE